VISLIDQLVAPGVVPLAHVVDNFSGDELDERWTFRIIVGGGSGTISDVVDGGYTLTPNSSTNNSVEIDFAGIKHYDPVGCIQISTFQRTTTLGRAAIGLSNNENYGSNLYALEIDSADTNLTVWSNDGSWSSSDTGIVDSENVYKIQNTLNSTSGLTWIDDSLSVVKTANIPSVALQPIVYMQARSASAQTARIRYMECYNT